ncbi:MAG: hypothetical protein R2932_49065 [Caldilineaceae bacterium]
MLRRTLLYPLSRSTALLGMTLSLFAYWSMPAAASPAGHRWVLPGGFVPVGESIRPSTQDATSPALAIQPNSVEPWVALVENARIVVSKYVNATASWSQQDGILNRALSQYLTGDPSLTFAGDGAFATPWAAWSETEVTINLIGCILIQWDGVRSDPIVNHDPAHSAGNPTIAAGALVTGATPLPWLAWQELDANDVWQIVVSRAQADTRAQGGFSWLPVGNTLNFEQSNSAQQPDLAFAGPSNTVPWVVWTESGAGSSSYIFAKRWTGAAWESVGRQANCADAVACALNVNAVSPATNVRITVGTLPNQSTPIPWIVFSEEGADGRQEIRVMRLDVGNPGDTGDDRFVVVGGAVNAACLGNAGVSTLRANNRNLAAATDTVDAAAQLAAAARTSGGIATAPDIVFVGNVPHVTWVEQASGREVLHVCHLADARAGLERWDLDTVDGVNRSPAAASLPSLATNGTTPYVAWQEGQSNRAVYVARRSPAGPAWAANFPATLTGVAGAASIEIAQATAAQAAELQQPTVRSASVPLMTAAYHVNGVENLEEVQLALLAYDATTDTVPVLLARYVISENLVYVQDPERPGTFFPPVTPGANVSNINTPYVTLEPSKMRLVNHGAPSPTLDVHWSLIFEDATFFERYDQAVNVIHDGGQATGFVNVGTVYVGTLVYLPVVIGE